MKEQTIIFFQRNLKEKCIDSQLFHSQPGNRYNFQPTKILFVLVYEARYMGYTRQEESAQEE